MKLEAEKCSTNKSITLSQTLHGIYQDGGRRDLTKKFTGSEIFKASPAFSMAPPTWETTGLDDDSLKWFKFIVDDGKTLKQLHDGHFSPGTY